MTPPRKAGTAKARTGRKPDRLTPKEELFAVEYVVDWNGTAAVRRAGYRCASDNAAGVQAQELLKKPKVKARIESAKAELLARAGIRAETVLLEIAKLAFSSTRHILTVDESGNVVMRPGSEIPDTALDAVSQISASDTTSETERDNGKGGMSSTSTRTRTIQLKLHDKRAALADLSRYLRLMPEQLEVSGPGGKPIQTEAVTGLPEEERAQRVAALLARAMTRTAE